MYFIHKLLVMQIIFLKYEIITEAAPTDPYGLKELNHVRKARSPEDVTGEKGPKLSPMEEDVEMLGDNPHNTETEAEILTEDVESSVVEDDKAGTSPANEQLPSEAEKSEDQDDMGDDIAEVHPYGSKLPKENPNSDSEDESIMGQPESEPVSDTDSDMVSQSVPISDADDENDESPSMSQVYGAGTLVRPVQNDESEGTVGNGDDGGDGFITEDPLKLKENVLTHVLEVELIDDGYDCNGARGSLAHVAHESKFFVDRTRLYNFKEARDVCSKYNLVIAEIEEVADHRTIEEFMSKGNYYIKTGTGGRFFIGLNDIKTEGVFRHANGKNVTYQNFLASQPDDESQSEDCVTIMKEQQDGAAGAADYDCNKTAHVFCMHKVNTQCYNDSKESKFQETIANRKHATQHDLHLILNSTERAYFVSNYQLTWKEAMMQCDSKQMKLFDMDSIVTMGFFRAILRWERNFFRVPMPTVQYWTSGKFKKSHMTAPIIWHTKPNLTSSEERGVEKHNATFSFSGLYKWSTKKKVDPGGPHGLRRDLCVSFGFDSNPEAIPFTRNTNCDLPTYFICYAEYPDDGKGSGEETTTEEGMTTIEPEPINPEDKPLPPEPENEAETAEIEAMFAEEGRSLNMSCNTNDEKDDVGGRNGIVGNHLRWWNGFTVYIENSYDKNARKLINTAMDRLRKVVCIPFYLFRRNQRPYGDYVHIRNNGQCYSRIGKEGGGQEMSLGRGCLNVGTIMHEMIHALGFWHEQARPDRDKYVNIFWNNIVHNQKYNFYLRHNVLTFGVPYNTVSIMHYRSWEFSANGRDTILDKNGGKVGSLTLQQTDIQKLKRMYNCK